MANIDLRLGRWRLGVRPDSDATHRRLTALLSPYADGSGEPTRTNFSVRGAGRWWKKSDAQLFVAADRVRVDPAFETVAHHLVALLAGVAAESELEREHTIVSGRLVRRGDRAVLITASCTGPLDASQVDGVPADLVECPVWRPALDPTRQFVTVPPPLDGLDWRSARLSPPADSPDRLELAGVVTPPDQTGASNLAAVWAASSGRMDEWGVLLGVLDEDGRAVAARTKAEILTAAARLLG